MDDTGFKPAIVWLGTRVWDGRRTERCDGLRSEESIHSECGSGTWDSTSAYKSIGEHSVIYPVAVPHSAAEMVFCRWRAAIGKTCDSGPDAEHRLLRDTVPLCPTHTAPLRAVNERAWIAESACQSMCRERVRRSTHSFEGLCGQPVNVAAIKGVTRTDIRRNPLDVLRILVSGASHPRSWTLCVCVRIGSRIRPSTQCCEADSKSRYPTRAMGR